jgi:hypothetical protein
MVTAMSEAAKPNAMDLPPTPDFDCYPVVAQITASALEEEGRILRLAWSGGRTSRYHAIWLRDNASDPENLEQFSTISNRSDGAILRQDQAEDCRPYWR